MTTSQYGGSPSVHYQPARSAASDGSWSARGSARFKSGAGMNVASALEPLPRPTHELRFSGARGLRTNGRMVRLGPRLAPRLRGPLGLDRAQHALRDVARRVVAVHARHAEVPDALRGALHGLHHRRDRHVDELVGA